MVDRHALGKASSRKGHNYEREIAKKLTPWYNKTAKEPMKEAFYIVPDSGARAWSKSMNVDGDVTADPTINFNYLVECKRYSDWNIENLMNNNSHFPEWTAQSVREGTAVERVPLLVYKRNYIKSYVTAPYNKKIAKELRKLNKPYIFQSIEYKSEVNNNIEAMDSITFFLQDFMLLPFDKANNIYKDTDWTKTVHTIKRAKQNKKKPKPKTKVIEEALKGVK